MPGTVDPTDRLLEARESVDRMAQGFAAAEQAAQVPVTEYDRTGTVTVSLTAEGALERITISGGWKRHYRPEELGEAVREAVVTASATRAHAWGERYANQREPATRPAAPFDSTLVDRLDQAQARGVDTQASLVALRDMLREFREAIDSVTEQVTRASHAEFTARSSSGHVRARVSGQGELLALEFAQPWVETAHPTNLGREATEAVRAALGDRERRSVTDIINDSALGDATRLSQDEMLLAHRLRLI